VANPALIKATVTAFNPGGTGNFALTPSEGTVTLESGLVYLLWGKESGGNLTLVSFTTQATALLSSVVDADTHPTTFTTTISTTASVPVSFDPRPSPSGAPTATTADVDLVFWLKKI
jgi:hypothetical protein